MTVPHAENRGEDRDLGEVVAKLETDVDRLKQQNRAMKWSIVAALVVAVAGVAGGVTGILRAGMALDPNRIVYAQRVETGRINLRDSRGTRRISLYVMVDGPGMALRDETGSARVAIHATSAGPTITLRNGAGEPVFHIP